MKTLMRILAGGTLVAALSGCVIAVDGNDWDDDTNQWEARAAANRESIEALRLGRSLESITREMGKPDITESFLRDGHEFLVYYYRTRQRHSDYRTTKDEATPLVFVNGELVGWGEAAIAHALTVSDRH